VVNKAYKIELETEERIFGRNRCRQHSVECSSAWYCQFRSSQDFRFQIRIHYVPESKEGQMFTSFHKDILT